MIRTFALAFSLKNTYRVNSILYALKQVPLLKRALPDGLYQSRGLKRLANGLSGIWEVLTIFLGKLLYFLCMFALAAPLYPDLNGAELFLHILFCLTIIGAYANTYMFNPTRDKYYAMILLGMNSREYALTQYAYAMFKTILGFLAAGLLFGRMAGLTVMECLMIPLFVAGLKATATGWMLRRCSRTGRIPNENNLSKVQWIAMGLLLAAAYGLPALRILPPRAAVLTAMALSFLSGLAFLPVILRFDRYREVYKAALFQTMNQMDGARQAAVDQGRKMIENDLQITSQRSGFEYLNELFVRRHRKILWRSSKRIAGISLAVILACGLIFSLRPESRSVVNGMLLTYLPYFVFIMYLINRGAGFTRALFVNCDHSLLTYSFYKQPRFILKLFQIRLREIIKVNLLPAAVIGGGMALLLYASGGTENPVNYLVLIVSILSMSMFFSMHYLTMYYLLQPYNAGTEMKSGLYQLVMSLTYLVCFYFTRLKMSTFVFGLSIIAFCLIYCAAASLLVYRFAPKTFKIRT